MGVIANILSHKIFYPLHESVRVVLTYFTPKLLILIGKFEWKVRHSALSKGAYHLLNSDVDMALILKRSVDNNAVSKAISKYKKIKKFLIYLGELEVYYEDEWDEKLNLEKEYKEPIYFVRNFRKLKWIQDSQSKYSDYYHLNKAKKVIDKLKLSEADLKIELKKFTSKEQLDWLKNLKLEQVGYLKFYSQKLDLMLPKEVLNFLLLVDVFNQTKLLEANKLHKIKNIILKHEILNYRAFLRADLASMDAMDEKLTSLIIQCLSVNNTGVIEEILNERLPAEKDVEQFIKLLSDCSLIEIHNPYHDLFLKINFSEFYNKVYFNKAAYSKLMATLPASYNASKKPRPLTISLVAPLSIKNGMMRINNIFRKLEDMIQNEFTFEVCGPVQAQNIEIKKFYEYSSNIKTSYIIAEKPSGVIIYPTIYNFYEDIDNIKKAMDYGLPVVAGYNAHFEERIISAMASNESSIFLDFDYLKQEVNSNHKPGRPTLEFYHQELN